MEEEKQAHRQTLALRRTTCGAGQCLLSGFTQHPFLAYKFSHILRARTKMSLGLQSGLLARVCAHFAVPKSIWCLCTCLFSLSVILMNPQRVGPFASIQTSSHCTSGRTEAIDFLGPRKRKTIKEESLAYLFSIHIWVLSTTDKKKTATCFPVSRYFYISDIRV